MGIRGCNRGPAGEKHTRVATIARQTASRAAGQEGGASEVVITGAHLTGIVLALREAQCWCVARPCA